MLVYFAIMLTGLLGFSGLVVDVGRIELRSLQLQAAADSAALSAASEYQRTGNWTTAQNAMNAEVAGNASLNGIPAATASMSWGTSGSYNNDPATIQVALTQPISTTLLSLIKGSQSTITASATAVALIPPCIYLMGHPSIPTRGNNNLELNSQGFNLTCPMYSTTGYYVDGFSHINGWQAMASGPAGQTYGGGTESPAVMFNAPVLPDPLAYIASPSFSSCTPGLTSQNYTDTRFIWPGTYCGGLKITGSSANVTMLPGLYIITGGVNISGGATVTGTGVTMYLTKGGGSPFGQFFLQSGSTMNVSAPMDNSAGGIPAILLMTDRAWLGGNQDIRFDTATGFHGDGLLYITGTGVYNWKTNMSGIHYFGFVVANFTFQFANLTFSQDYSQLPGGNPFRTVISLVQ